MVGGEIVCHLLDGILVGENHLENNYGENSMVKYNGDI
jgi:hypothetical protein